MSVYLRLLDLEDVDLYIFLGHFLQLFLELVHLGAAFSDDNTRTGCMDSHSDEFESPLDDNLGKAGFRKTVDEIFTDFIILCDLLRIVTTTPVRVPTTGDTDSVADRICLLSHNLFLH